MRLFATTVIAAGFLTGCVSDVNLPGSYNGDNSRFSIASYKAIDTSSSSFSGLWIAIHEGELNQTSDGVKYKVTGKIREIVEITQKNNTYYARTCSQPEKVQAITVSGNSVTIPMNDDVASLTKSGYSAMSGTASHSSSVSSYSGTLQMKKVAPLNDTFGLFNFYTSNHATDTITASCFQDGSLHIVGSKSLFSQWSDVDILNVSDWTVANKYQQTGYMFSRAGTADPARQMRFREGNVGDQALVREYPANNEKVNVSALTVDVNKYMASYSIDGVMSGKVDMSFAIAEVYVPPATTGNSTTNSGTTTGSSSGSGSTTTSGSGSTSSGSNLINTLWSWAQTWTKWHW